MQLPFFMVPTHAHTQQCTPTAALNLTVSSPGHRYPCQPSIADQSKFPSWHRMSPCSLACPLPSRAACTHAAIEKNNSSNKNVSINWVISYELTKQKAPKIMWMAKNQKQKKNPNYKNTMQNQQSSKMCPTNFSACTLLYLVSIVILRWQRVI